MRALFQTRVSGIAAVVAMSMPIAATGPAQAQSQSAAVPAPAANGTVLEQSSEHRFQLDLHVNEAALAKMLPTGWESNAARAGAAKDANLRMIFIDRIAIVGPDGKMLGKGSNRLVYLAAPVKQTGTTVTGQMIVGGISEDAAAAPGAFGTFVPASEAEMTRTASDVNGVVTATEDWDFAAASGEHMQMHVKYERGAAAKGSGETKFYYPADPSKFQIFKTEQTTDITRNVTTNPPDRVAEFSYRAGGGAIATLFDGSEKLLSWDSQPWYIRTISIP